MWTLLYGKHPRSFVLFAWQVMSCARYFDEVASSDSSLHVPLDCVLSQSLWSVHGCCTQCILMSKDQMSVKQTLVKIKLISGSSKTVRKLITSGHEHIKWCERTHTTQVPGFFLSCPNPCNLCRSNCKIRNTFQRSIFHQEPAKAPSKLQDSFFSFRFSCRKLFRPAAASFCPTDPPFPVIHAPGRLQLCARV